jgi:hypothetical protein
VPDNLDKTIYLRHGTAMGIPFGRAGAQTTFHTAYLDWRSKD